jgi:predicted nucleotidyltransferase
MQTLKTLNTIPLNYNETLGLKGVISELTGKYPFIKKIILYGSKARGVFIENSDLDLLFITENHIERQMEFEMNDIVYNYELANDYYPESLFSRKDSADALFMAKDFVKDVKKVVK